MNTLSLDNATSLQIDGQAVTDLAINGVTVWGAWEDPVQTGDILLVTQVYSAVQNGDILEVE